MVTTTLLEVVGAMNACVSGDADSVATAAAADRIGGKKDLMDDVNFCILPTNADAALRGQGGDPNKLDPKKKCPIGGHKYIGYNCWIHGYILPYLYPNCSPPAPWGLSPRNSHLLRLRSTSPFPPMQLNTLSITGIIRYSHSTITNTNN